MTMQLSTGLRDMLASGFGFREAMSHCRLRLYSGAQPANADAAASGTLLATFTKSGGAFTAPVQATGDIQITGGSGSITSITVAGLFELLVNTVPFNTSVNQTAQDLADEINANRNGLSIRASVSTDTVTIYTPFYMGSEPNTAAIAVTTTLTVSADAALASGVDGVNGLNWIAPASGVLAKESDVWQATAIATGTAGWFRFEGDPTDDQASSSVFPRMDGDVATAGADLNLSSTAIVSAGVYTINSWPITVPAS